MTFRDLRVWQEAHRLVLMIYELTQAFPESERFGLVSQMRRAAVSVPAHLVEGFKRKSQQDKIRFYNVAEASLEELKYFLLLSRDLAFLKEAQPISEQAETVSRLLYRFIESVQQNYQRTHPKS
jgi:four helix bundle protein